MKALLAQLTDPHIRQQGRLAYGRLDTAPYLREAIASVLALPQRPDAVVLTGDLTDFGQAGEYAHLRSLLLPLGDIPVYLMPGNHDDRGQLRKSFPEHVYLGERGPIHYGVDIGELRLLALDTVVPGAGEGRLDDVQLEWLASELEQHSERPVVIAMHHPPFDTLIGYMDRIGLLRGKEELQALVSRHGNVERIISGHLHRSIQVRFGDTIAATAPSVAHQICLDLAGNATPGWTLEPPGFCLHALDDTNRIVTHTALVGDFEGPFGFDED